MTERPIFEVGDMVKTPDGTIGLVLAFYPVFDWGRWDYYVQINEDIEIYRAEELQAAELG